jgi:hypothetical protein
LPVASNVLGQSTDIAITSTVLQPAVKRLGMNLGTKTYYDSGQTTKNLLNQNPGFEGQIWNSTIRCMSGTATSCTDEDQWAGWPAGFWNGATFQIFYGAAAGRTGVVTNSTAAGNGQGPTFTFSSSGVAPALGDYMIVHMSVPGNSTNGWWPQTEGAGKIADNLTDLPPSTTGRQTVSLNAPSKSDSAAISGYFDSTPGRTFLQLNGTYQIQFKAKGTGGGSSIAVSAFRGGVATYLSQTVALSGSWNTYTLTFTAAENGSAIGIGGVTFATVGADSFYLDDVSVSQINTDSTNMSVFRDEVVNTFKTLQPGIIRYWGGQLGETLDNLLTPSFGRQMSGFSPYTGTQSYYGLHDFLVLCQLVGAEPWVVVPTTFTDTDSANLIEYLAGDVATIYGAKRGALGQTSPWTQVFTVIHLEFGNEAWNPAFKGGDIEYSAPYGQQAQHEFGIMRAVPEYQASKFDLVLGGQAAWPGRNTDIQNNCNNNDSFDVAPYTMNTVDSFSDNESLFGSTFAEPEAYMSANATAEGLTPGMVYQDVQAIQSSNHPVPVSFYEMNLSTLQGSITQAALNSFTPSLGAGLMVADTMLLGMKTFGIVNQNVFALPQYEFSRPDGSTVFLWGTVVDMGATNRVRPQFLTTQLVNSAIASGSNMLATSHTGANPTWNEALTNTVAMNGAHFVQSYAFSQGSNMSLVVFNLSRTTSLPVTFSGVNAPSGTVQMQQLTSANPTDNNESANVIQIQSSTLNGFAGSAGLSLPPYSLTVLRWVGASVSNPTAPVISNVASTVSGTSATVTWTTDQASTSVVNYGTSAQYGTSASGGSTLTTSHSVTLSNLQAGATYDYQAVSANASGQSSNSANSTFTVSATSQPPVISAVTATTSGTSVTITWSTDQASSSVVNYGLNTNYGLSSAVTTLTTSHSVTLSGLQAGATYDYQVVSANASGTPATSANYTFAVSNQPAPNVQYVSFWGINSSGITMSWSTDQPATTQVSYGTSPALGQLTPLDSTLIYGHGAVLTGLMSGTTYYWVAQSTNANGVTGYSTVYSFTTLGSAPGTPPIISNVAASPSGTSVTVTWTTDQASTSVVNYGTSTQYGTSANGGSTLTTSHSVTLSNLQAGTTYDYQVVSANTSGAAATSANSTFTVSTQPAPNVQYVSFWGINSSGITMSWSTDQPATTQVAYGTSPALGQLTPLDSTLIYGHGTVLTGLLPGTTYYWVAQSTNANGVTGYSTVYSFTTLGSAPGTPPIISNVAASTSGTSVTVTWTTDQASTSVVNYGTSTQYGTSANGGSTLTTSHSVTLSNLQAGTIYDYQVVSANTSGAAATSANSTFTVSTQPAPNVQYVSFWGINSSGITMSWSTDQPATTQVAYGTSPALGQLTPLDSTLIYGHGTVLTGLMSGTTYYWVAQSTNANGVTGYSKVYSFTTR